MPNKIKIFASFTKFRLSFLVVVSALSGYLFNGGSDWKEIILLMLGGMLVTAASNGSNQIWERDIDINMKRTAKRPLPTGTMTLKQAYLIVILCLVVGLTMLLAINWQSAALSFFAYLTYVFAYTPLKRVSNWAVFVGAIPGAIPPMLGAIAVTGEFGFIPGILFFVQFCWQFPHFWAIAWVVDEDYKAGGFSLLPSKKGKSKSSAFQIAMYSLALIPFSLLPWWMGMTGTWTLVIVGTLGSLFFLLSYKLFLSLEDKDAKRLMFASFIYLPIIQFVYVFDKIETIVPV
ncbi:MAG: protoheme IX farnesyltransferase [Lentimonas sp.]|jgi:protoheme IX farnesyltransferase